jgi:hypothetical protein
VGRTALRKLPDRGALGLLQRGAGSLGKDPLHRIVDRLAEVVALDDPAPVRRLDQAELARLGDLARKPSTRRAARGTLACGHQLDDEPLVLGGQDARSAVPGLGSGHRVRAPAHQVEEPQSSDLLGGAAMLLQRDLVHLRLQCRQRTGRDGHAERGRQEFEQLAGLLARARPARKLRGVAYVCRARLAEPLDHGGSLDLARQFRVVVEMDRVEQRTEGAEAKAGGHRLHLRGEHRARLRLPRHRALQHGGQHRGTALAIDTGGLQHRDRVPDSRAGTDRRAIAEADPRILDLRQLLLERGPHADLLGIHGDAESVGGGTERCVAAEVLVARLTAGGREQRRNARFACELGNDAGMLFLGDAGGIEELAARSRASLLVHGGVGHDGAGADPRMQSRLP